MTAVTNGQSERRPLLDGHDDDGAEIEAEQNARLIGTNGGDHRMRQERQRLRARREREKVKKRKTCSMRTLRKSYKQLVILGLILLYLGVGCVFYALVEGWTFSESFYFAVISVTTVGYGDMHPTTNASMVFTAFYAVAGIILVFTALSLYGNKILAAHEQFMIDLVSGRDPDSGRATDANGRFKLSHFTYTFVLIAIYVGGGTLLWALHVPDWNGAEAFYFSVVTLTTIGYGDLIPDEDSSRWLNMFFVLSGVIVIAYGLGEFTEAYISKLAKNTKRRWLDKRLKVSDFRAMDSNHDGRIDYGSFLEIALIRMELVDRRMLDAFRARFRELDVNDDLTITFDELMAHREAAAGDSGSEDDYMFVDGSFSLDGSGWSQSIGSENGDNDEAGNAEAGPGSGSTATAPAATTNVSINRNGH